MEEMGGQDTLTRAEHSEFNRVVEEFDVVNEHRRSFERRHEIARLSRNGGGSDGIKFVPGSTTGVPEDNDDHPARGMRDGAMRQLECSVKAGLLPARGAEIVERLVGTGPAPERSWASRWVTETGSDAYRSAFAKVVMHGEQRAALEFTATEAEAFRRVASLKTEQRAMSLTDNVGGYLVPYELDPTVVLTRDGSINPLLSISRVINNVSDVWHGVSSAGVSAHIPCTHTRNQDQNRPAEKSTGLSGDPG
ncbi:MAG: hypothetical protein ACM4D3_10855 [Candidatus Sericytochromatia bacterium]